MPKRRVGWSLRESVQRDNVSQIDGVSDMAVVCICTLGMGRAQQRNNGFRHLLCLAESCLSHPHPEAR